MANDKSDSQPENPGKSESLSATDMFLRSFGENPKPDPAPPDPLRGSRAPAPPTAAAQPPATPAAAAGEFTQLFQSLQSKPAAAPVPRAPAEPPIRPSASPVRTPPSMPSEHAGDRGPGEFTRIFVGGSHPPTPRSAEEPTRPVPLPTQGPSRSKGFSPPGVSGSASGEGSFTQMFSSPSSSPSSPPAQPPPPNSSQSAAWKDDPLFRPQSSPPSEPDSPSVTSLLASLGSSSGAPSARRQQEPVPYQPEPNLRSTPLISPEPHEVASGSVTRFIERLANMPAEPAPASPMVPAAPPPNSGPSEYTRIISRMEAALPAAEPPAIAPQPAAAAPPPTFAFPAAPQIPVTPVPLGAAPAAAAAPRFTPPPVPDVPMPVAPKPPALTLPALAPPKSKLEAMVPILLVINTFLLLILLVVVLFLIKSR